MSLLEIKLTEVQQNYFKNVQPALTLCGNFNVCFLHTKWQFYFQIKIKNLKEFVT